MSPAYRYGQKLASLLPLLQTIWAPPAGYEVDPAKFPALAYTQPRMAQFPELHEGRQRRSG